MGLRIVFMGTPGFAVPSLKILHESEHEVVGVITSTDKYGGRGNKQLLESDVKKFAIQAGLHIMQPPNLKADSFNAQLKSLKADLQVVVAFRMLPEMVWNMPRLGTMNLHGSLLPKYRGAAPINWAVINGEKETGLTTFLLKHEIDTGDMLEQSVVPIDYLDSVGSLHDKMMLVGADLVLRSVNSVESGNIIPKKQNENLVCKAPKIFNETCEIDFNRYTRSVYNFIRGLDPYPGAYTYWKDGKKLKLFSCEETIAKHSLSPGSIVIQKDNLLISTLDGYISVKTLQLAGKKRMSTKDFLNGLS